MEDARNRNRSVGAMLSGELIRRRPQGLPDHTIFMQMEGTGGQSFGAFLASGITMYLIGDANDYTGKGLSGGRIVVRPSIDFRGDATQNIIIGNTALSVPPAVRPSSAALRASALPCACQGPPRWSRARATMAAST